MMLETKFEHGVALGPSKVWIGSKESFSNEWRSSSRSVGTRAGASVRILSRIAKVTDEGLEYEADQRHAEILAQDVGIDGSSRGVVTPEAARTSERGQLHEGEGRADREGGDNLLRGIAARGNYLGQDRMGVQFAAKEVSRFTSKPEAQDWSSAKRLARYLKDNKREGGD